ncbi:hypothetical protein M9Y10_005779 [Tritrichomonas musculus]|uniref:BTB domain-containing protein n=1 Tax=Tritrichomonas musculus TaxID=1915356 RepID=A0ABR2JD16_9EUKA
MSKQGVLMNLGNESDDEESVSGHLIEIKLTSITIQISFIQLYKYSQLFRDKYLTEESRESLSEEILQFQNQFDIKEENIILFFKLIQDENVSIINDNYRDLRKLSDYFKVQKLRKFLDKYSKNYLTDLDSIIIQILNSPLLKDPTMGYNDTVNAELEDKLCDKINDCFQNSFFCKIANFNHLSYLFKK